MHMHIVLSFFMFVSVSNLTMANCLMKTITNKCTFIDQWQAEHEVFTLNQFAKCSLVLVIILQKIR